VVSFRGERELDLLGIEHPQCEYVVSRSILYLRTSVVGCRDVHTFWLEGTEVGSAETRGRPEMQGAEKDLQDEGIVSGYIGKISRMNDDASDRCMS
jgi:hypothetical protein